MEVGKHNVHIHVYLSTSFCFTMYQTLGSSSTLISILTITFRLPITSAFFHKRHRNYTRFPNRNCQYPQPIKANIAPAKPI